MSQSLQSETLKFEIRLAQPSEVDRLIGLHMAAFKPENNIPVLLGRRYVRATYCWLVTSKQSYALIAADQDKIIGLVAVVDSSFTKPMFKACFRQLLWSLALRPSILFKKRLWQRFVQGEGNATQLGRKIATSFEVVFKIKNYF